MEISRVAKSCIYFFYGRVVPLQTILDHRAIAVLCAKIYRSECQKGRVAEFAAGLQRP